MELSIVDAGKYLALLEQREKRTDTVPLAPASDGLNAPVGAATALKQAQIRFSDEQTAKIIAQYRQGASTYQLAAQYGCHRTTISLILRKAEIALHPQKITPPEKVTEIVELREQGKSYAEIVRILNCCSAQTVRTRLLQTDNEPYRLFTAESLDRTNKMPHTESLQ